MKASTKARRSWYVVYSRPHQERRAEENLQNQGFEVFLPTVNVERRLRGKIVIKSEPLFPRYLFVRFDEAEEPWNLIRNTLGVASLLRIGMGPAKIADQVIDCLRETEVAQIPLFRADEPVRIIKGPLRGLEGVFLEPKGESRAMILVELLQKTQQVKLDLADIVKI